MRVTVVVPVTVVVLVAVVVFVAYFVLVLVFVFVFALARVRVRMGVRDVFVVVVVVVVLVPMRMLGSVRMFVIVRVLFFHGLSSGSKLHQTFCRATAQPARRARKPRGRAALRSPADPRAQEIAD
jgi:hypothetical protein